MEDLYVYVVEENCCDHGCRKVAGIFATENLANQYIEDNGGNHEVYNVGDFFGSSYEYYVRKYLVRK